MNTIIALSSVTLAGHGLSHRLVSLNAFHGLALISHHHLLFLAQTTGVPSVQPIINLISPIFYILALIAIGHGAYEIHEKREFHSGLISLLAAFLLAAAVTIVRYIFASQGQTIS